jgi:surfactin synthase thioesterase subunit/acyl carrier protein
MTQAVAELLGEGTPIDPHRSLAELGLDSLMSVSLVNRLEPALGVVVPMAKLLKGPNIEELVDTLFPDLKKIMPPEVELYAPAAGAHEKVAPPRVEVLQSEWIVVTKPNPDATVRLFCFPFAGGGSAVYRLWNEGIGPSLEVIAVEPPGRLARIEQSPVRDVQAFATQAAGAMRSLLDKPFAMFGHCLGALTMYETARELQRAAGRLPIHLFVSGSRAPDCLNNEGPFERLLQERLLPNKLYDPFLAIHEQPEEIFVEVIRLFRIDSTEEMLKSAELRALVLPVVRAEFEMAFNYRYRQRKPWSFPITCFNGENDLYVTRKDILSWSRFTTASFQVHIRRGEHFLLVDDRDFVLRMINREITQGTDSKPFDQSSCESRSQPPADVNRESLNVKVSSGARARSHPVAEETH